MNLENAKQEFLKYVSNYDSLNPRVENKKLHSLRVMKESEEIAKSLNLSNEEIELAQLIGLLHDIGKFEQAKIYNTNKNLETMDHGDFGVKILQENNYIRKYILENKYDNIILKAIKNHSKFQIEEGLTEKELLFAKIIRDADKLDIFYEGLTMFWNTEESRNPTEESEITPDILNEFKQKKSINKKDIKTSADSLLSFIAFKFDLNFEYSIKKVKEKQYIEKIIEKFDFKNEETKKIMEQLEY